MASGTSDCALGAMTGMLPVRPTVVPGSTLAPHRATASALAGIALAATATVAIPGCGHRVGVLSRTMRCWAALHAGAVRGGATPLTAGFGSATASQLATSAAASAPGLSLAPAGAASLAAPWRLAGRWLASSAVRAGHAATPAATAPGRVPAAGGGIRWRQPQQQQRLRPSLPRGSAAPAAVAAPARGGVLGGGRAAGGLSLPLRSLQLRQMATEAATSSSSASPRGLLQRFRGRFGEALRLQLAAAWQAYGILAYATVAVASIWLMWRVMHSVTNTFIVVNDKMAEYGLMALAASVVLLAALYLRWRTAVNPAAVYRKAMVQLNTNPGVLEVMGAPLVGSPVRAYLVTGGGVYLSKKFRIKLRARRIQMMFPISGGERKGLVSLEAKRKKGHYVWKLLAVDVGPELQHVLPAGGATGLSAAPPPRQPQPAAPLLAQHRVYVVGDLAAYQRGGVLGELRVPFLQALSNSKSYEVEDELEDELDELDVPKAGAMASAAGSAVRQVRGALSSAAELLKPPAAAAAASAADDVAAPQPPSPASEPAPSPKAQPAPPNEPEPQSPQPQAKGSWWRRVLSGPEAASTVAK